MSIFDFLGWRASPDAFAKRLIAKLQAKGWSETIRYDSETFALHLREDGVTNLSRMYRDWLTYPVSARDKALDQVVAHVFESVVDEERDQDFSDVAPKLLPLVRNRSHTFNMRLDKDRPAEFLAGGIQPLAEHLCVLVAVDQPASIAPVTEQQLQLWGKSFEEILDVAVSNLRAKSTSNFERQDDGFFLSRWDDQYDASRLLLPELFQQLPLVGAPVAIVVSRRCIAVAGADDTLALNAMARFVNDVLLAETRAIAYAPLTLHGDRWLPFEPTTLELAAIRSLNVQQRVWDYAEQGSVLEDAARASGTDIFAVPLVMFEDDGVLLTWTSWTENCPSLLPKASYVGLTDRHGAFAMRAWDDIQAVCGAFSPDLACFPARFRTQDWPGPAAWSRLITDYPSPPWGDAALAEADSNGLYTRH